MKNITSDDYVAIQNLLGKYQWLVDEGDSEGWADLWVEDGVFTGGSETRNGREELKNVPKQVDEGFKGRLRHHIGSFHAAYGSTTDEVHVNYYNLVTTWVATEGARFMTMALSSIHLVRMNGAWKIRSNTTQRLLA